MRRGWPIGLFVVLTVAMTWPQARSIATEATPHQDVYFNMWRLEWFAHAMATHPAHLFDTNIFFPETDTLALSDAMLVEGSVAAPFAWIGIRPVLLHNLLLLGAIAFSGAAMFALARYLTGSRAAGIVAGIVFAFAPYRFEHIMHMEMQWTMWMPLAFLALHRTLDTGKMKYGLATGLCTALQMLSSIYYGIFLVALIALAAVLLIVPDRRVGFKEAVKPLVVGAVLAMLVSAAYARPYMRVHERTGDRPMSDVEQFSARPSSYLSATPNNWLYGGRKGRGAGLERRLFPGTIALLLATAGVLLVPPSRRVIVYLILLVAAFEMSLGFDSYLYTFLYQHVTVFRGLRALARLGAFVLMFVAVLAAYGYRILVEGRGPAARLAVLAAVGLLMLVEYHVTLDLVPYPNQPPPIYRVLAQLPRGVVIEFPVPPLGSLPGDDAEYVYMSTFHWFPLANGYSGVYPASYLARLEHLHEFPSVTSLNQLRADNVRYVIVHKGAYSESLRSRIETELALAGMAGLGSFSDGGGVATLYRMP